MTKRDDVVAEARSWVGTPFKHQAKLKHVGCDCLGLTWAVGEKAAGLKITPDQIRPFMNYGRQPNPKHMRLGMETFLVPITEPQDGDIVWVEWREHMPMHVGILATFQRTRTIIHCLEDIGKCVEHGFTAEWVAKVNSYWSYPALIGVD